MGAAASLSGSLVAFLCGEAEEADDWSDDNAVEAFRAEVWFLSEPALALLFSFVGLALKEQGTVKFGEPLPKWCFEIAPALGFLGFRRDVVGRALAGL